MRRDRPSRHIGFHDLMDAMQEPGCPICRLANLASHRWLAAVFHGLVNDRGIREDLRESAAFCSRHTQKALQLGDPLGGSIIYADILRHLADRPGAVPHAGCPCCRAEATAVRHAVQTLLAHILEEAVSTAYAASEGLCLPHLRRALAGRVSPARRVLEELERAKLRRLAEECQSMVGQSDHEHIADAPGPERDAWRRAARKLAGDGITVG